MEAGVSQGDLGKAAGLSQSSIAEMERSGQGSTAVTKMARKLGVDAHWLATGEDDPQIDKAWPFTLVSQEDYRLIAEQYRQRIENELAGEIQRIKGASPARSADEIRKVLLDKERRTPVERRISAKRH